MPIRLKLILTYLKTSLISIALILIVSIFWSQYYFSGYGQLNKDGKLPNENNQQFIPKYNGFYKVIVTDGNGCETISDSVYFERIFLEIKVYPNPSTNRFIIEIPQTIEYKAVI